MVPGSVIFLTLAVILNSSGYERVSEELMSPPEVVETVRCRPPAISSVLLPGTPGCM